MKLEESVRALIAREKEAAGIIMDAYREGMPSKLMHERLRAVKLPAKSPRWAEAELNGFIDGYCQAMDRTVVAFLYEVDGEVYGIRETQAWAVGFNLKPIKNWRALPEELHSELGQYGALYWVYPDRAPAQKFKSEEEG